VGPTFKLVLSRKRRSAKLLTPVRTVSFEKTSWPDESTCTSLAFFFVAVAVPILGSAASETAACNANTPAATTASVQWYGLLLPSIKLI
jgi:hypothetical protein